MPLKMTKKRRAEYKDVFNMFDRSGDGTISRGELGKAMASAGHKLSKKELQDMFNEADTDHNKRIDFDEFLTFMANQQQQADPEMELRLAFEIYDRDHTGFIQASELRRVLNDLGHNITDMSVVEAELHQYDLDGDARIDYKEFLKLIADEEEEEEQFAVDEQDAIAIRLWHNNAHLCGCLENVGLWATADNGMAGNVRAAVVEEAQRSIESAQGTQCVKVVEDVLELNVEEDAPLKAVCEKVIDTFAYGDTNRDGTLSKEEAKGIGMSAKVFDRLDGNKDGVITLDEYVHSAGKAMASKAFVQLDTNKDGTIDFDEARAAGISCSSWEEMDANKDELLSKSEFVERIQQMVMPKAEANTCSEEPKVLEECKPVEETTPEPKIVEDATTIALWHNNAHLCGCVDNVGLWATADYGTVIAEEQIAPNTADADEGNLRANATEEQQAAIPRPSTAESCACAESNADLHLGMNELTYILSQFSDVLCHGDGVTLDPAQLGFLFRSLAGEERYTAEYCETIIRKEKLTKMVDFVDWLEHALPMDL